MESLLGTDSLLEQNDNETMLGGQDGGSVVDVDMPSSFLSDFNPDDHVIDYDQKMDVAARRAFLMNPENQALILLNDYIMRHPERILTGKQKRNLRREFLRNAKKGRYMKMFEREVYGQPDGGSESFENLNS